MEQKHTIAVIVNDQPGVLQRVAGLFGRRGFNIDSITVGNSEESGLSRMTIVTEGDERTIEQIEKQLYKLIDVVRVDRLSDGPMVSRELALIKVRVAPSERPEVTATVEAFRAGVIDIGTDTMTIQATGESVKLERLIALLAPYGIAELSRTGATALRRGEF
ncbi:acetolactate synthase small subunit [Paenibacillus sp. NPDC058071]|uniref:acetolactate synthase small subunit n=1 Tax=Paenibacillus sp. NPDC058071 TaxID=3346326 RepID=UPI0036DAFE73